MNKPARVAIAAGLLLALYVSFEVGRLRGLSTGIRRAAENDALTFFALLREGRYDLLLETRLTTDMSIADAQEQERSYGRVRSFRLERTDVTPLGLPVVMTFQVTREKGVQREALIRHWSHHPRLDYHGAWGPKSP